jgi:hypothetical protein
MYMDGARFFVGFDERRTSQQDQPFGPNLPFSTEQILHASKYSQREAPVRLTLAATPGDTTIYEDDLGELETRVALQTWGSPDAEAISAAAGWNGDRFRVLGTRNGTGIIWVTAWDTPQDAIEFERSLRRSWERAAAGVRGRRSQIDMLEVQGVKLVRLVDAPEGWAGWRRLPAIRLARPN